MSDSPEQQAVWVFPPKKKRSVGKIIVILVLAVVALGIAALFLLFLWQNRPEAAPSPSSSPSLSASPSSSPSPSPDASDDPSPSPSDVPSAEPSAEPTESTPDTPDTPVTEPPAVDPDLQNFATQVSPRLDDALTGISLAEGTSGSEATGIVDNLLQDAQSLSDTAAPTSISGLWADSVVQYSARLQELRSAYESGGDIASAIAGAQEAVYDLRSIVGI